MTKTLQPAEWPRPRGFSNGMSMTGPGRWILVSGQIGSGGEGPMSDDMAVQTAQALRNVVRVLAEDGARPEHLVRLVWYVTNREEYLAGGAAIGAAWREIIGKHFPTMTLLVVSGLLNEKAKVEIEAQAFVGE